MSETRNIVFLGASYAGLGAIHYFARHVYPHLPKDSRISYKIIVVDPSTKFFLRHASPRKIIGDDLVPDAHIFMETADALRQYGDAFSLVQGSATAWDPEARTVKIRKDGGLEEVLSYHALVLATGTKTHSPLFSLQGGPHTDSQEALREIQKKLAQATSVVIAGGGPAGVEAAGEIGELLNGQPGWFSSRPANPKAKIDLYTNSDKLLPVLRPAVSKQAEGYLNRVGVDVHYNTKVSAQQLPDGKAKVTLSNGTELMTDVYIPATGLIPMSEYVPKQFLDEHGYIKTNGETSRVEGAGARVFAVGDVASYTNNSIVSMLDSIPVFASNLKRDLLAAHLDVNRKPSGPDRIYKPNNAATQIVPIGQGKGVGEVFGWRVPSWFVWMLKSRTFMVGDAASKDKLMGNDWAKEKVWKGETVVA